MTAPAAVRSDADLSAAAARLDARRTDDDWLMIRLQGGDARAFDELVERHQSDLFGFFFKNTRDRPLAEDLTQDTLLKVYSQSWDYLPLGRFRGWMFRIARNLLIDSVRRRSRDALVRALKSQPTAPTAGDPMSRLADTLLPPEAQARHHELAEIVETLLAELPPEQRMTFTLHHFHGLPLPEVADALETSTATTKSRLRLAREKLQARLTAVGIHGVEDFE